MLFINLFYICIFTFLLIYIFILFIFYFYLILFYIVILYLSLYFTGECKDYKFASDNISLAAFGLRVEIVFSASAIF